MTRKKTRSHASASQPQERILKVCAQCQDFLGRNVPQCQACREVVERMIQVVWADLLRTRGIPTGSQQECELAATVLEHSEQYWWSEVEAAMQLTRCPACGGPLGYGTPGCEECVSRSDMLWGRDLEYAADGSLQKNEHAMRVALRGLGQAHRHSQFSLDGWRLCLPLWLQNKGNNVLTMTREQMQQVQAIGAWMRTGRGQELMCCQSFAEMYAITRQGRK